MTTAQQIAEQVLGPVKWTSETHGLCTCPGAEHHTKSTKDTDCEVYVDENSHVHCFHGSCEEVRELASTQLRTLLEGAGIVQQGANRNREKRKKVRYEEAALEQWRLNGMCYEAVQELSPVPTHLSPSDILWNLYPDPEERLVVFVGSNENQGHAMWPREQFVISHSQGLWFLPQPVTGRWVDNPRSGKRTRRSAECVTDFRYIVAEADEVDSMWWLSYLIQMQEPIAAIYTSGGRSIHALIRVDLSAKVTSAEQWAAKTAELRDDLILHGADPKSLTSVRLTRVPNAMRGPNMQRLLYLNPEPTIKPIYYAS
jgi:hypothetical protein